MFLEPGYRVDKCQQRSHYTRIANSQISLLLNDSSHQKNWGLVVLTCLVPLPLWMCGEENCGESHTSTWSFHISWPKQVTWPLLTSKRLLTYIEVEERGKLGYLWKILMTTTVSKKLLEMNAVMSGSCLTTGMRTSKTTLFPPHSLKKARTERQSHQTVQFQVSNMNSSYYLCVPNQKRIDFLFKKEHQKKLEIFRRDCTYS